MCGGFEILERHWPGEKDGGEGNYLRIDDERLGVIWATAAELNLPVLLHIADPVAFFKPIGPGNERCEELARVPAWSFANRALHICGTNGAAGKFAAQ